MAVFTPKDRLNAVLQSLYIRIVWHLCVAVFPLMNFLLNCLSCHRTELAIFPFLSAFSLCRCELMLLSHVSVSPIRPTVDKRQENTYDVLSLSRDGWAIPRSV